MLRGRVSNVAAKPSMVIQDSEEFYNQIFVAWLKDTRVLFSNDRAKRFRRVLEKGLTDKEFVMRGLGLGVNSAIAIGQKLIKLPLDKLDLYENVVRDEGAEALAVLVKETPSLTSLNLGANDIGPNGMYHIAAAAQAHRRLSHLMLGCEANETMTANQVDTAAAKALADAIRANTNLRVLDLNNIKMGKDSQEAFKVLTAAVDRHPQLLTLRLGDTGMSTESAMDLAVKVARHSVLHELNLSGNSLSHHMCRALAKVLQDRAAADHPEFSLQKLFIQNNPRIGAKGSAQLFNLLCSGQLRLTTLDMSNCGVDDDAVLCLANALDYTETLQSITLRRNHITHIGCLALSQHLENHQSITTVSLSSNKLTCDGAVALAAMLEYNNCLRTLELDDTRIGDQGCVALGVAIAGNFTIEHVKLSCNHITDEAGKAFICLLEKNRTVQQITVRGNQIDHSTQMRLRKLLKRNKMAKENELPEKLQKEVVRLHYQQCKLQEANNELAEHTKLRSQLQEEISREEAGHTQERQACDKRTLELADRMRREQQEIQDIELKMKTKLMEFEKFQEDIQQDLERLNERLGVEVAKREEAEKVLNERREELSYLQREKEREREIIELQASEIRADTENFRTQQDTMMQKIEGLQAKIIQLEAVAAEKTRKDTERREAAANQKAAKADAKRKKKEEEEAANALLFDK